MEKSPKVEVCSYCSGFDVSELKGIVKAKIGCIGKCSKKNPELDGKVYGFLNGVFIVCDTKEEFLDKISTLESFESETNKNPLVDAFLEHVLQWRVEHDQLREICLSTVLKEELKWGQPCYTTGDKNMAIIGGFKNYIALSFFKGALMKDRRGILVQQTEKVQAARQLRFTSLKEIIELESVIKEYLEEAIEIEKAGLALPVTEKKALEIPEELQAKFDEDTTFEEAFYALTPGRQRGYIYHFSSAKQSATRTSRIEKVMEKIFSGKGLED